VKLITKEIRKKTPYLYGTEDKKDKIATAKFFNPCGVGTWYLIELDEDENQAFGLVDLHEKEYGYFSIKELESIKLHFGLKIERDKFFKPTAIDKIYS
tara:strand:- start:9 stop:302 length:294 start_codon:yes stop_codon:yes gene_type:complete